MPQRWQTLVKGGVSCADVGGEPDQLDNTWGEWDYPDDYRDKSRVRQEERESSIDLGFPDVEDCDTGSVSGGYLLGHDEAGTYRE